MGAVVERKAKALKKAASGSGFSALKALGSLLAFFSRLEMLCMRLGIAWMVRDPIIILLMLLVLVVQPIIAGVLSVWRFGRQSLRKRQLQARGKSAAACKLHGGRALSFSGALPRSSSLEGIERLGSSTCVLRRAK